MGARIFLGCVGNDVPPHKHEDGKSASMCPICDSALWGAPKGEWIEVGGVIENRDDNADDEGR